MNIFFIKEYARNSFQQVLLLSSGQGEVKILLIRSKKNPSVWIFPKAYRIDETAQQACVVSF